VVGKNRPSSTCSRWHGMRPDRRAGRSVAVFGEA